MIKKTIESVRLQETSLSKQIQQLRLLGNITLESLSKDSGYPVDFLREIEEEKISPPVAVVLQLGRIFNVDIEHLQGKQDKEVAERRSNSHKKRVASYAYEPLSQPGKEKHLRAYRVSIDPQTEHMGVEYHHEGEEFIYILEGGLSIQVGQNLTTLGKGESIHFDSALHHKLSNPTSRKTELLVVIHVP